LAVPARAGAKRRGQAGARSAIDVRMLRVWLDQVFPQLESAAVELRMTGTIGGVTVQGTADVITAGGMVIDLKTASKKPAGVSRRLLFWAADFLQPGLHVFTKNDVRCCRRADLDAELHARSGRVLDQFKLYGTRRKRELQLRTALRRRSPQNARYRQCPE
jgi:hypothetical protein